MIYLAEVKNQYVMAIFERKSKMNSYLEKLDKSPTVHLLDLKYPFFILENSGSEQRFSYYQNKKEITAIIANDKLKNVTVYKITSDYKPRELGADEMGRLDHDHV